MSLPDELQEFLKKPVDENLLSDKGNTPFASFTFIDNTQNTEIQELSFSGYMNVARAKRLSKIPSTHGILGCIGLSKIIQGTYMDQLARSDDDPDAVHTEYGHCDMIRLDEHVSVIISIIASPQDSQHFFTYIKNQVEIIHLAYT